MATKLYFHSASSTVGGTLPTTEQSSLTADFNADPFTTNRSMNTTIGTSQTSVSMTAPTSHAGVQKNYYWCRFVSPLINGTSISANTWTYDFGTLCTSANNSFPVGNGPLPVYVNCYVWKPSNGTKVGTILDGNTASTVSRFTTETNHWITFTGAAVSGLTAGDAVIIFEAWFKLTPAAGVSGTDDFFYDGADDVAQNNVGTSDCAAYISTPQTLTFTAGGGNAVTKSLTETITIGQPTPTIVKAKNVTKTLTETTTIGQPTPTKLASKKRAPAAETITISEAVNRVNSHFGVNNITKALSQTITLTSSLVQTTTRHTLARSLIETIRFSDSLNFIGKTKHTGDPGYWLPLKPRINIYAFTDTTYSNPIYTYNAFTDSGNVDKPLGLQFSSESTNAGTFSLQIDNSNDTYDPDQFSRGNRITIECSKDNSTWTAAYHGLVRSVKQKVFGPDNRIIYIEGYSYLIRLSERLLSVRKQATILPSGLFDRTDTTMNTDNLLNDLLTNDANYLHSVDDTQLYSVFKTANILSSPIEDWIPRIDAQLATLNDVINSIVEYSQSLVTIDFSNDQIVLFNPDRTPTGGANAFLVTDSMILQGDSSLNTMYPVSDYSYQISYDFADSANRLIAAIGSAKCPEVELPGTPGSGGLDTTSLFNFTAQTTWYVTGVGEVAWAGYFILTDGSPLKRLRLGCITQGAPTGPNKNRLQGVLQDASTNGFGQSFYLYPESQTTGYGDPTLQPPTAAPGVLSAKFCWTTQSLTQVPNMVAGRGYWIWTAVDVNTVEDSSNRFAWGWNGSGNWAERTVDLSTPLGSGTTRNYNTEVSSGSATPPVPTGGTPGTTVQPCGGLPEPADADPILMITSDRNNAKRIGMVEQVISNLPPHVKTLQSMNEYLFNKIYVMGKPRFTFDYPNLTVPATLPKAGDICVHISKKAQVGRARTSLQTGIITQVQYEFGQDSDSILGLRRLSLSTSGVLRGSY